MTVGSDKIKIKLIDIDHIKWLDDLQCDLKILKSLLQHSQKVDDERDAELADLKTLIRNKIEKPINDGNKKVIIFSAFADTVKYLYEHVADELLELGLHSAMVVGTGANKTMLKVYMQKTLTIFLLISRPYRKSVQSFFKIEKRRLMC